MTRCICSGILFVDIANQPVAHLPVEGELVETEKIQVTIGGHAANVSLNLHKLGVPVTLSGCVGRDALSDYIVKSVSLDGIDVTGLKRVPADCPGTSMLICVEGQDRRFISTTGANDLYEFDDLLVKLLESKPQEPGARVFYLGGFLMLKSLENERTPQVLRIAKENGWTTLCDIVLYGKRPYLDALGPLFPYIDYFTPNNDEAVILTGRQEPVEQARYFLDRGVQAAIITQGERGTLYYDRSQQFQMASYQMPFVSGAGSGDAFCAGFIAALLAGSDPIECVRWGSAQGASCVRGVGTTETAFSKAELEAFLDANPLPRVLVRTT